jgi:hypothetical protein
MTGCVQRTKESYMSTKLRSLKDNEFQHFDVDGRELVTAEDKDNVGVAVS